MSEMVSTLVPRFLRLGDAVAGHLPAADAELHQIGRRDVRQVGRPVPGRGVHALVEVLFLDVDVAVEMDDADALRGHVGDAAHAGKADRMVAAQHDRQRAGRGDVADALGDLVEALFEIGRDGEDVAGVAQRHLLAQVDAELVIVGRVERRDAADALRPEAGSGPVGGAAVERDAHDGRVIFADVADILDIGRLEEGVDAGEMRQLAAREGRDRLVDDANPIPAGPCRAPIAAPCASRSRAACPRPRSTSSPACRGRRNRDGGSAGIGSRATRPARRWPRSGCFWACQSLPCDAVVASAVFSRAVPTIAATLATSCVRSPVLAVELQIVGDRRAIGGRELRVVAHLVEDQHAGAELEGLADVVGDHDHGHAVLGPELGEQLVHLDADAGIERAERLVEKQDLRPAEQASARSPAAAACRRRATPDRGRAHGRGRRAPAWFRPPCAALLRLTPKTRPNGPPERKSSTSSRFCMAVRCGNTE